MEDTCGELWSRPVSGNINGKVDHLELYSHCFHTPKHQVIKDQRVQNGQLHVATDLLKQNKCRTECVGHLPITVNICTHPSQQYN